LARGFGGSCWFTGRRTGFRTPPAAILCEIADEVIHRCEISGIDKLATEPPLGDETGVLQLLEMEG
jgi:hypothetical protein